MDKKDIAGIVLAGGKSSRMGENKALLRYNGKNMIDHMQGILYRTGIQDIYISGDVPGYVCIPDTIPHSGPATAILDLMSSFKDQYKKLVFVPVDMPMIHEIPLRTLMDQNNSAYYKGNPLPACLITGKDFLPCDSVRDILIYARANPIALPQKWENSMINTNTPEEWEKIVS